uniref:Uncharacterized protein n=1 Tax=Solanum lycopersicum TaxID=4081 RepID=A0A3Q7JAZ6_SOLLC
IPVDCRAFYTFILDNIVRTGQGWRKYTRELLSFAGAKTILKCNFGALPSLPPLLHPKGWGGGAEEKRKGYAASVESRDMDLLELSAYGDVRRGEDSGGCKIQ